MLGLRRDKVAYVRILITDEMRVAGAEIIDSFDCAYESSLDAAEQIFLAMLAAQKDCVRGKQSAPKTIGATVGDADSLAH